MIKSTETDNGNIPAVAPQESLPHTVLPVVVFIAVQLFLMAAVCVGRDGMTEIHPSTADMGAAGESRLR